MSERIYIGDALVRAGLFTKEQLEIGLTYQKWKQSVGRSKIPIGLTLYNLFGRSAQGEEIVSKGNVEGVFISHHLLPAVKKDLLSLLADKFFTRVTKSRFVTGIEATAPSFSSSRQEIEHFEKKDGKYVQTFSHPEYSDYSIKVYVLLKFNTLDGKVELKFPVRYNIKEGMSPFLDNDAKTQIKEVVTSAFARYNQKRMQAEQASSAS